jgi:hypothetical protein
MKRLIERVVARVSIVGLVFVTGCAALIGADFDKELAEADASGGTGSGGTSPLNTGGVITSGGATSDGGSTSGGTGGGPDTGGASGVGGAGSGGDTGGSGAGGSGASNTGGVGTGGTSVGGSGGAGTGGTGTGGTVVSSAKVAINEVCGHSERFIELFNYGSLEYDLSYHAITDSDGADPKPPLNDFPSGTVIAAGEYLRLDYQVDFGFSITNEKYYLLDPFGTVISVLEYPGDVDVPEGSSYGRDPNGTGAPKILSEPSPGAAN